jgi:hypothetical protein
MIVTSDLAGRAKFPVPTLAASILKDWASDLSIALGVSAEDLMSGKASIIDHPLKTMKLVLMDQSVVEFRHALFVVNEARKAIAVFSEHCGYHVFPYHEAMVYSEEELVYRQTNRS